MKKYYTLILLISIASVPLYGQLGIDTTNTGNKNADTITTMKSLPMGNSKLEIGIGVLTYFGDLNNNGIGQTSLLGQLGYNITFKQPLTPYLEFNINAWGGKISANEQSPDRNLNFESKLFSTGLGLTYNFSNFRKKDPILEPIIGVGVELLSFSSYTDLLNNDNITYNYWSDGTIRNLPETATNSESSIVITRDYHYETGIEDSPYYGLSNYNDLTLSVPITIGAVLHISKDWDFGASMTYHLTFNDLIDGVDPNSGNFKGSTGSDNILYTSASITYTFGKSGRDDFDSEEGMILVDTTADDDKDGVYDLHDLCLNTPMGVKVDSIGCPLDDDYDGVPNYGDDELHSAKSVQVDAQGNTLSPNQKGAFYDRYYDTTGLFSPTTAETYTIQEFGVKVSRKQSVVKSKYSVGIGEFEGEIPADLMNHILSVEDVNTHESDGKVIVTVGSYETKRAARKRQKELIGEGVTPTNIVKYNDDKEVSKIIGKPAGFTADQWENTNEDQTVIYRIQVGAFKNKADEKIFNSLPQLIRLNAENGYYRYYTGAYKSYSSAASAKIDIASKGFVGAFIVAFRNGQKITLQQASDARFKPKNKQNSSQEVNQDDIKFKVQLGSFKHQVPTSILASFLDLGNVEQIKGEDGFVRYTSGSFTNYKQANAHKLKLRSTNFTDCYVVAVYNGKIISVAQANKLLGI